MADVHRPSQDGKRVEGKFPVILIRTCYDKDNRRGVYLFDSSFFVKRGYVVVIEDVRGRYKSPGRFYHGIYEANDGYDTIEWIAKQSWSSGKIGMTGLSYLAAVQQAAAASGPPISLPFSTLRLPCPITKTGCGGVAPSSKWSCRWPSTLPPQAGKQLPIPF